MKTELSVKLFAAIVSAIQEVKGEEVVAYDDTKFKELNIDAEQKVKIANKVEIQDETLLKLSRKEAESAETVGQMVSAYLGKL